MAEWLVEDGIGEQRALLVQNDTVLAAKCRWPGELHAGQRVTARLASRNAGSQRGLGTLPDGRSLLIDRLPRSASEGSDIALVVTRGAIAEKGRFKLAAARPAQDAETTEDVFAAGQRVRRLPEGAWEEIWQDAWQGEAATAAGSLVFSATPAMTLIDVDGDERPSLLALAAVPPIARAIRRFDLGGSIGIDFPTIPDKAGRRAIDAAFDTFLADWPHERTAMNGFGFVQIVARLEGMSLLHRMAFAPLGAAARLALRRAEMVEGPGVTVLTVNPSLVPHLAPEWLAQLERRTARGVRIETDPALAIEAPHAQLVAR